MGMIIDTCVFIRAEKQQNSIDFDKWMSQGSAYISVITVSELLVGVHRADTETRRLKRSAFVEAVLAEITALEFTEEIARVHAELYSSLAQQNQLIGAHDLIIAATAIAHGYPVLTTNHKEFDRVPALKVLRP